MPYSHRPRQCVCFGIARQFFLAQLIDYAHEGHEWLFADSDFGRESEVKLSRGLAPDCYRAQAEASFPIFQCLKLELVPFEQLL